MTEGQRQRGGPAPGFVRAFTDRSLLHALPFASVVFLLLLGPLFIWPAAHDSFVLAKDVFFRAGLWVVLALTLAASFYGRSFRLPLRPITAFLLAWVLWQGISVLWAPSPGLGADQVRQTATFVGLALLLPTVLQEDRRRILALGWVLVLAALGVAGWALFNDFEAAFAQSRVLARLGDWRDVIGAASLGNSGHAADFIVQGFLVALVLALTTYSKRAFSLLAVCLWVFSAALIVAWSVHSNASLLAACGLLVWLMRKKWRLPWWRKRARRLGFLAAGWVLVVAFFVVDHPANPHGSAVWNREGTVEVGALSGGIFGQAFSSGRWKEGGSTRVAIWLTTLQMVAERPWFGWGAGNFTWVYPATISPAIHSDPELSAYAGSWTNAAHNSLLQTWSETGILGVALLIALVGAAIHAMGTRRREESYGNAVVLSLGIAMLVAIGIQGQMSFPLELPVSSALFFCLIVLPLVLPKRGGVSDLVFPVRRNYPGVRLGIMFKNMHVPTELLAEPRVPKAAAPFAVALVLAAAGWLGWQSTDRLRANMAWRTVYEGMRKPPMLAPSPQKLEEIARRALALDPGHVDARAALTELWFRQQRYEDVLAELPIVYERLNAIELHVRQALALEGLGRPDEALVAWDRAFRRRPQLAYQYPRPFARWTNSLPPQDGEPQT
ncbi:MAG: O-antigen ligase family protein [Sumerlaeia bacterium]